MMYSSKAFSQLLKRRKKDDPESCCRTMELATSGCALSVFATDGGLFQMMKEKLSKIASDLGMDMTLQSFLAEQFAGAEDYLDMAARRVQFSGSGGG